MCGILGFIGGDFSHKVIIEAIKLLQNRGYDSSGISINNTIIKYAGTNALSCISRDWIDMNLSFNRSEVEYNSAVKSKTYNSPFYKTPLYNCAGSKPILAHCRWATTGVINDLNAQPHKDTIIGKVHIVHNGIIENYYELKKKLPKYIFSSTSDSEIICAIIAYYYNKFTINQKYGFEAFRKAVENTFKKLKGTWACIIKNTEENALYCIRNSMPILVGQKNGIVLSSEQGVFNNLGISEFIELNVDTVYKIGNDFNLKEFANKNNMHLYNSTCCAIVLSPDPYPDWTIREIKEQHYTVNRAICWKHEKTPINYIKNADTIIFVGSGTSLNACKYMAWEYKKYIQHVNCISAGDFVLDDLPSISNNIVYETNTDDCINIGGTVSSGVSSGSVATSVPTSVTTSVTTSVATSAGTSSSDTSSDIIGGYICVIFVSQSGETKDTVRCIETIMEKRPDVKLIAVINEKNSMMARIVENTVYTNAGREVGVASTKSFTNQVMTLDNLLKSAFLNDDITINNERSNLPNLILSIYSLENKLAEISRFLTRDVFILGKFELLPIADEAALKIKELGYINANSYSLSDLKHGPYSTLYSGVIVIVVLKEDEFISRNLSICEQILSRGGRILLICDLETNDPCYSGILEKLFNVIYLPKSTYFGLLANICLQFIAYYFAKFSGNNVDRPRFLAKAVTTD